jgi:hypothetical protein
MLTKKDTYLVIILFLLQLLDWDAHHESHNKKLTDIAI